MHHSITLAFSQDPLEQQPGIISKHLVATPFPSAAAQLISMPLTCHIKYLHSLGVSPILLWEMSRNHQSFIYLSFSLSSHRLTSHPWESKKNPACYFLASKCYTSFLDQVSPTQACITSPIWLLCHCMPLVFFLPLSPSNCTDTSTQTYQNSECYYHPGSTSPVFFILTSGNTTHSHSSQKSSFLPFPTSHI